MRRCRRRPCERVQHGEGSFRAKSGSCRVQVLTLHICDAHDSSPCYTPQLLVRCPRGPRYIPPAIARQAGKPQLLVQAADKRGAAMSPSSRTEDDVIGISGRSTGDQREAKAQDPRGVRWPCSAAWRWYLANTLPRGTASARQNIYRRKISRSKHGAHLEIHREAA